MRHTDAYGLNLPEGNDIVDVDALNENSLIIDTAMDQIRIRVEEPVDYREIINKPTSLPASDVYPWAKSPNKPAYTASEVGTLTAAEIADEHNQLQDQIDLTNQKIDDLTPITDAEIDALFA